MVLTNLFAISYWIFYLKNTVIVSQVAARKMLVSLEALTLTLTPSCRIFCY